MHLKETPPLELDRAYPCPSCKQGMLIPITLTEAWGCDRCKQIFERKADLNTIGKPTTPYPRQRCWKWDGKRWVLKKNKLKFKLSDASTWTKIVSLLICLWLVLTLLDAAGLSISISALILLALVVMFWVVLRR